jgi:cytochrome c-type biogenesis protein CcmH/NrfF
MNRREAVRMLLLGSAATTLRAPSRGAAQDTARPDSSDRLYDPSMVQARSAATAADNDAVIKGIERRLKCTCGCNLDIYTCRTTDFTCTYSPALHQEVLELRREAKDPDAIVAAFVAKYGEQVLMAPKPEGFNLAGYLLPGAAVLTAGALLVGVLWRRSRRRVASAPADSAPALSVSPADEDRLRRALADVVD